MNDFPFGTTLDYQENDSSAELNLPAGSTVLYADICLQIADAILINVLIDIIKIERNAVLTVILVFVVRLKNYSDFNGRNLRSIVLIAIVLFSFLCYNNV